MDPDKNYGWATSRIPRSSVGYRASKGSIKSEEENESDNSQVSEQTAGGKPRTRGIQEPVEVSEGTNEEGQQPGTTNCKSGSNTKEGVVGQRTELVERYDAGGIQGIQASLA